MHRESMTKYGARIVTKMESQLGESLIAGESPNDAVARIETVAKGEWYQAERIVRTETAWAFNATQADGMVDAASELDDLYMRWSEHVDDETGEPLDDRVAADSLALHGQVVRPGGEFLMPGSADVQESLQGRGWPFPTDRPNDRACLAPWRPGWGVPGWEMRGGRKVMVALA
jgi:hypothetical protein